MIATLADFLTVLREMPRWYADRINRWVRDQHRPFDVAGDGTGPAVCHLDGGPWPCQQWLDADERIGAAGSRP